MRLILFIAFLFPLSICAQNLVPNPSFEDNTSCPVNSDWVSHGQVNNWYDPYGTANYYHECGSNGYNVPNGIGGGGDAYDGKAYVGIGVFVPVFNNGREFVEVELSNPLTSGKKYNVEFHVSLIDSAWYAISSIGACLTEFGIGSNLNQIFALTSQVESPDSAYLDNNIGWTKVSGNFIAQGGEKYIAIGNFKKDSDTDTLFVGLSISTYYRQAHYYLDMVSVIEDTTVGINENLLNHSLNIFPNPTKNILNLQYKSTPNQNPKLQVELFSLIGQQVLSKSLLQSNTILDVSSLPAGVYLLHVNSNGERVHLENVVITD